MNRPLRLVVCSLPYICEKSTHTWVFVGVYITQQKGGFWFWISLIWILDKAFVLFF